MLETKTQVTSAIREIKKLTGWNDSKVASEAGINKATVSRLKSNKARFPELDTREAIYKVLIYARGLKK